MSNSLLRISFQMNSDCHLCEFSRNFKDFGGPWHCINSHNKISNNQFKELTQSINDCNFFEPLRSIDSLFEWDEVKNQINIRKHKISFSKAQDIFNDCIQLVSDKWDRDITSESELQVDNNPVRGMLIGKVDGKYWTLIYVFKGPIHAVRYRVISIRRARKKEIEQYKLLRSQSS